MPSASHISVRVRRRGHDKTYFPEDSEFFMTFLGPLQFIDKEGNTVALVGWEQAHDLWAQQTGQA